MHQAVAATMVPNKKLHLKLLSSFFHKNNNSVKS